MRVVALLSGGKDSVAAIEVAQGHGWDVVAAVRIVPQEDSMMFHTPNMPVVAGVAKCLGLPLISMDAGENELEALAEAIAAAAADHDAAGVVSGAIASDYQKTRIDGICHRLEIASWAPLWHKNPRTYMEQLVATYDMRLARVAADGLQPDMAGRTIDAAMLERFGTLRMHIAGEGGEYESLVLDAPHYKQRLEVEGAVHKEGSRSTWEVSSWRVVDKD